PLSVTSCALSHLCPLSLHDARPIVGDGQLAAVGGVHHIGVHSDEGGVILAVDTGSIASQVGLHVDVGGVELLVSAVVGGGHGDRDRKSTRLNSSHVSISYAVYCLKK